MGWPGIRGGKVIPRSVKRLVRHGRSHTFASNNAGHVLDFNYPWSFVLPLNDLGDGRVDINPAKGVGSGTFTRATIASCKMRDGTLKKVAAGIPRSHYLVANTYGGYYAEGARTNLLLRSEELNNALWDNANPLIPARTVDAIAAPDDTVTAELLTAANVADSVRQNVAAPALSTMHAFSIFTKNFNSTGGRMLLAETNPGFVPIGDVRWSWVNNVPVITSTPQGTSTTPEPWKDGWYRLGLMAPTGPAATNILAAYYPDVLVGANAAYAWGAQLEAAAFPSSYIPTIGATVTRNDDILAYPGSGNIGLTEGTLYAEMQCIAGQANLHSAAFIDTQASLTALSGAAGIGIGNASGPFLGLFVWDGAAQADIRLTPADITAINKIAGRYAANSFQFAMSGNLGVEDVAGNVPAGLQRIVAGVYTIAGFPLFGTVRNIRLANRAISDAEIQLLTGA